MYWNAPEEDPVLRESIHSEVERPDRRHARQSKSTLPIPEKFRAKISQPPAFNNRHPEFATFRGIPPIEEGPTVSRQGARSWQVQSNPIRALSSTPSFR